MNPENFPQANCSYHAPEDLAESQVLTIKAYKGVVAPGSSMDGARIIVTCWRPDACELERIKNGGPIFLTTFGGLPPHFLSTDFAEAIRPA